MEPAGVRWEVPHGETALLIVDSNIPDEVHVHGYDLLAEVGPGQPAHLQWEASIPGIFEIELETGHQLLANLVVS